MPDSENDSQTWEVVEDGKESNDGSFEYVESVSDAQDEEETDGKADEEENGEGNEKGKEKEKAQSEVGIKTE